jgi:hypothetical protein
MTIGTTAMKRSLTKAMSRISTAAPIAPAASTSIL